MGNFNDSIKEILKFAFTDKSHSLSQAKAFVKAYSSDHIHVLDLKENAIFVDSISVLEYIFIQIKGFSYVVNYTLDGRRIIADTFADAQIFGLIEAIHGTNSYKGTVVTLTDCLLVKVSKEKFIKAVYSDIDIASIIIKYLADFSTHSIEASVNKAEISPYENLIIFLYNKTLGKKRPYAIKEKKAFIADLLQIDKRTLYRYLNKLSDRGMIRRERQDILVSDDNFERIEKLFNSIHHL